MIKTIIEDQRNIEMIQTMGDEGSSWEVDGKDFTKIVPYHENGQGAHVIWFAVYKKDEIVERVNGASVEFVFYGQLPLDKIG